MRPGWSEITWSVEVISPGLVSEGYLNEPPDNFRLVLYGPLWYLSNRQTTQGFFWPLWYSWLLFPYWIIRGGIWRRNSSACGTKTGSPPRPIPKGTQSTTAWPCPPSWDRVLPQLFPTPPSWWVFGMGYRSELGGLILTPGSCLGPILRFPRCLPRRPSWSAPLGWENLG